MFPFLPLISKNTIFSLGEPGTNKCLRVCVSSYSEKQPVVLGGNFAKTCSFIEKDEVIYSVKRFRIGGACSPEFTRVSVPTQKQGPANLGTVTKF